MVNMKIFEYLVVLTNTCLERLELPAAVRLFTFIVMDFSSILILFWNANYVESLVMFDCVQYL